MNTTTCQVKNGVGRDRKDAARRYTFTSKIQGAGQDFYLTTTKSNIDLAGDSTDRGAE